MPEEQPENQTTAPVPPPAESAAAPPAAITKADIEKNKMWAVVSYLTVIGLIIALLAECKDSPFVKFHINQSLVLVIAAIINMGISLIPFLGWIIAPIVGIALLVLWIMGVVNAAGGQVKRLPVIGDFDLIK